MKPHSEQVLSAASWRGKRACRAASILSMDWRGGHSWIQEELGGVFCEDRGGAPKDFSNRGNNMKIPRPRAGQVGGFLVGQIELRRKAL